MPETLTILVLGLIVASCVLRQRTAHARTLTVLALVGSMLSILSSVTLQLVAPVNGSLVIVWLDLVLDLVVPVLVVVGLATLLAWQRAAAGTDPQSSAIVHSAPSTPAALPSSQLEPVWQPDEASGAAWYTAGDAALGAPAAGWGTPGESGGWQSISDEDDPSRTDRSAPES